ncbi:hypothetical protein ACA910_022720 [Epithemia clementina (nom. ined.)]
MTKVIAEYVGLSYSGEIWLLFVKENTEATFDQADDPSRAQMEKYKMLWKIMIEEQKKDKQDKAKVFQLIISQCTMAMKNWIESLSEYKDLKEKDSMLDLWKYRQDFVYTTNNVLYEFWTMQVVMRRTLTMKQAQREFWQIMASSSWHK